MEGTIIYKKEDLNNKYALKVYNPRNILLVSFFLEEVGSNGEHFIKWFSDLKHQDWSSELVDCCIDEGIVEFTPAYIFEIERIYQTGNFFQMPVHLLFELLREWIAVEALAPEYIKVQIDAHKVIVREINKSELFTLENIIFVLETLEIVKRDLIDKISFPHSKPIINNFPPDLYFLFDGEIEQIGDNIFDLSERLILLERTFFLVLSYLKRGTQNSEARQEYFDVFAKMYTTLMLLASKGMHLPVALEEFVLNFKNLKEKYIDKIRAEES